MIKYLFITAICFLIIGFYFMVAYTDKKKVQMNDNCNSYYILSVFFRFLGKVLCLVVLGLIIFKGV